MWSFYLDDSVLDELLVFIGGEGENVFGLVLGDRWRVHVDEVAALVARGEADLLKLLTKMVAAARQLLSLLHAYLVNPTEPLIPADQHNLLLLPIVKPMREVV